MMPPLPENLFATSGPIWWHIRDENEAEAEEEITAAMHAYARAHAATVAAPLAEALDAVLTTRGLEVAAGRAYRSAQRNFTDPAPDRERYEDAMMRTSAAEEIARAALATYREESQP